MRLIREISDDFEPVCWRAEHMMKHFSLAVGLAISMSAGSSCVTSPSKVPGTVSGVVSGLTPTGQGPVEGIRVTATFTIFGGNKSAAATTDTNGFYSISVPLNATRFRLEVNGRDYEFYRNEVPVNGDARIDIHLVRRVNYTLSGVVSEMISTGLAPVAGVRVDALSCDEVIANCEVSTEGIATTDGNGFYSIPGLWTGRNNFIWFSKLGYSVDGTPPGSSCDGCSRILTITGDTRLDIQLVRR